MVNRIQDFFNDSSSGEGQKDGKWDYSNIDNFHKWINDNKSKIDSGKTAMKFVMEIGSEVAAAACVKWLHSQNVDRDAVERLASKMADLCIEACDEQKKTIIADCASMFANTGSVIHVMMTAFVCYSLIGATVAQTLASEAS